MSINSISFMYMFMFEVVILSVLSGSIIDICLTTILKLIDILFPEDKVVICMRLIHANSLNTVKYIVIYTLEDNHK